MRLKYRTLTKLTAMTGFGKTYLCDLVATRKRPGSQRALILEKATGVHHDLWLYRPSEEIKNAIKNLLEIE